MDDGRRTLDHVTENATTRRARLRALAVAKGYDLNVVGLPDAQEIMRLADEPSERQLEMTTANRPRLRAFLLGIDPGDMIHSSPNPETTPPVEQSDDVVSRSEQRIIAKAKKPFRGG